MELATIREVDFKGSENGMKKNLARLYGLIRRNNGIIHSLAEMGYPALSSRGNYSFNFLDDDVCIVTYTGPQRKDREAHTRHFGYGTNKEALENGFKQLAAKSLDQFLTVVPYPLFSRAEMVDKFGSSLKAKEGDPNAVYRLALEKADFEEREYNNGDNAEKELNDLNNEGFKMVQVEPSDSIGLVKFANRNYPDNTFDPENVKKFGLHYTFIDPEDQYASLAGIGGKRKVEAEGLSIELYLLLDGITRQDIRKKHLVSHLVRHEALKIFQNNPQAVILVDSNNKSIDLLQRMGFKHVSTDIWTDYLRQE